MAKKQTRKSISITKGAYEKLKAYSVSTNKSMSGVVENLVNHELDKLRVPRQGEGFN